jgi:dihydrofolate reductase
MAKVLIDISMSLDGYVAGPDDDVERLHDWLFSGEHVVSRANSTFRATETDAEIIRESFETTGAVIMGRRTFNLGDEPWGAEPAFQVPCFVLTHHARDTETRGETTFTFVTDGIENALDQAKAAAGDKNVTIMGANAAQQYLEAGLVDELQIHLVPVLLGDGTRLFEDTGTRQIRLERTRAIESPDVAHLRFRVVR